MKKIFTFLKCSSLIAIVGYSAFACVNHDYDFKNITDVNTDITVGGSEFALPIGSLDSIALSRFLSETDFLTVNNGKYEITQSGVLAIDVPRMNIAPFRPQNPVLGELILDFSNFSPSSQITANGVSKNSPSQYANLNFTADATLGDLDINIVVPGIDKGITSVKALHFQSAISVVFNFSLTGLPSAARVAFDQYTITMPDYMVFADPVLQSTRKLVLDNVAFTASGQYSRSVSIVGLVADGALTPSALGEIKLNGDVTMQGGVKVSGENIDPGQLQRVVFRPTISIGQMAVGSVTAKINPDMTIESQEVILGDVPDFLRGEGTKIDLFSVALALDVNNPIDVKVNFGVDLTPYINGVAIGSNSVSQTGMVVEPHPFGAPEATTLTKIWFSNILSSIPQGYTSYINPSLSKVIETIPDKIEIQPTATIDQTLFSTIDLNKAYSIGVDYRLVAPLSLGKDFMISYTEMVEDIGSQISSYLTNTSSIEILTSVLSDIPLQFTLVAKALDANGSALNSVQIEMKAVEGSLPGVILPCDASGRAVRSDVVLKISETTKGALTKMDKINLTFTGAATQIVTGQSLAPRQSLKVDMSAKIPGGITIKQ